MISGYRSNNGLGPVVIDADLMRLASEQARAMAARGRPSDEGLVRKNFENNPTQGSLVT